MSFIRAITMTILLSFVLVASASAAFIFVLSGYPNPEAQSFNVQTNETEQRGVVVETEALIQNNGANGPVRVETRLIEGGVVIESKSSDFSMARGDTREVTEEFIPDNVDRVENVEIAVFAPGRPELIQSKSEVSDRIPEP